MKIIGNITQTYSYNRSIEIERFLEKSNVNAFNLLDIKTFSFHNCSKHFKKWSKEKILKKIPDCIFFEFNNISYGESIILYLQELKKLGCTDIIMWQDDNTINTFENTFDVFKILLTFYKNSNINYIKIYGDYLQYLTNINVEDIINIKDNLKVYKYNIKNIEQGYICYNDGNFILDINIAIDELFTNEIINKDVWKLEKYLDDKIKTLNIYIYFTNAYIFDIFNIHGRTKYPYFTLYQKLMSNRNHNKELI